jgi:minor extracellular serine protease Vpr
MKNYISVLSIIGFTTLSLGQAKMSASTKVDVQELLTSINTQNNHQLKEKFPVYRFKNTEIVSVLAKVSANFDRLKFQNQGIYTSSQIKDIVVLKIPIEKLNFVINHESILFLEIADKVQPTLDRAVFDVRADSVHLGYNLPQSYTGKNVYIGILDWGFDYKHPMFYDTSMTQTRIAAAWDQYKKSGPPPNGFDYGTEYSSPSELLDAGSDTANIYGYAYHGSHVAGIAGGGGAGTAYRGVAFESEFLFATFLIDLGAVLDAYEWMYQKAQNAGKRLIINQSWGLYHIGNLDGTSLLSQAIDSYSDLGVVFATSGGNNGSVNFHIKKEFENDTLRSRVHFYSNTVPNYWGQSITLWGEESKNFSVSLNVTNSSNISLNQTPFYSTLSTPNYIDSILVIGNDTLFFNVTSENANVYNNRPFTRFRVRANSSLYRIIMNVAATDGTVHAWNVAELSTGVGNMGTAFSSVGIGTGTIGGDSNYGIGEPACTKSLIAVASYSPSFLAQSGNLIGGALSSFSSKGPTLDERHKPDISAPGSQIMSSISSFTNATISSELNVSFEGKNYPFARLSGTSMSSPVVAGVIALMLEANPNLSSEQIKEIIIQTARTDNHTGAIPEGGSLQWGWGKINAYNAVKMSILTSQLVEKENGVIQLYPNPSSGIIYIKGDFNNTSYSLTTLDGKTIQTGNIDSSNQIDISEFNSGVYLLTLGANKTTFRVVRE